MVNDYIEQRYERFFFCPIRRDKIFYDDKSYSKNRNGERESEIVDPETDPSTAHANESTELVHRLSLDPSKLVLVDTRSKFDMMLRTLICENMVAFDAEWKPTFFSTNEVALIQLV